MFTFIAIFILFMLLVWTSKNLRSQQDLFLSPVSSHDKVREVLARITETVHNSSGVVMTSSTRPRL